MAFELAPVSGRDRALAAAQHRAVLRRDVADALARSRRFVAVAPLPTDGDGLNEGLDGAEQALADAVAEILDHLRREQHGLSGEQVCWLAELAVELQRLHGQVREVVLDRAVAALGAVGHDTARADGEESVDDRLRRAVRDLVEVGGFDRALLLRFHENRMEAVATDFRMEDAWARDCLAHSLLHPAPLGPELLEWQVARSGRPALALDPMDDPHAWAPMVHKFQTSSYVSIPVLVGGEAVAIMQADMYFSGRDVDALDRDIAAAFINGLGRDLERGLLLERLHAQRTAARHLMRTTEETVAEFRGGELWRPRAAEAAGRRDEPAATAEPTSGTPRVDEALAKLTRREREVVALMATGATNAAIAARLVVSEHTVKSHVEHILGKLRVANRAEAVARTAGPGHQMPV
jgi:LuxR family transcriptional regulator, regulator of acetate metabolism